VPPAESSVRLPDDVSISFVPLVPNLILSAITAPVTDREVPSKVRFALSSNSPPVPAITTRSLVRSETCAVARVVIPDTFSEVNVLKPEVG